MHFNSSVPSCIKNGGKERYLKIKIPYIWIFKLEVISYCPHSPSFSKYKIKLKKKKILILSKVKTKVPFYFFFLGRKVEVSLLHNNLAKQCEKSNVINQNLLL